jgi:hypothetical protein
MVDGDRLPLSFYHEYEQNAHVGRTLTIKNVFGVPRFFGNCLSWLTLTAPIQNPYLCIIQGSIGKIPYKAIQSDQQGYLKNYR